MSLIIKAAQFAAKAHEGQKRKYNGRPYITHPIRVAGRMAIHELANEGNVAAAYLHDVIEDCGVTREEIANDFGHHVADIVFWLSSPPAVQGKNRAQRKQEDRKRLAAAPMIVKHIKMMDRIDNLIELDVHAAGGFAKKYAEESILLIDAIGYADKELATEAMLLCREILDG